MISQTNKMLKLLICAPCCGAAPPKPRRVRSLSRVEAQTKGLTFDKLAKEDIVKGTESESSNKLSRYNSDNDEGDLGKDSKLAKNWIKIQKEGIKSGETVGEVIDKVVTVSGVSTYATGDQKQFESTAKISLVSKSRIGDYARIEYSSIDELESDSTVKSSDLAKKSPKSQNSDNNNGLVSSEKRFSEDSYVATSNTDANGNPIETMISIQAGLPSASQLERPSRVSSPGIESTSISIASQLSNEFLEQSLTNVLDSAQTSPTPIINYGTIGLPLGPPYVTTTYTDTTGKSTPETTGAALTAADDTASSSSAKTQSRANSLRRDGTSNKGEDFLESGGAALIEASDEQQIPAKKKGGSLKRLFTRSKLPDSRASTLNRGDSLDRNETPTGSQKSGGSAKKTFKGLVKVLTKKSKKSKKDKQKAKSEEDPDKSSSDTESELAADVKK